jgi:hypothetical protein
MKGGGAVRAEDKLWAAAAVVVCIALTGSVGSAAVSQTSRPGGVTGLQCPSRTLCVGIGRRSANLLTLRTPHSGAARWVAQSIDGGRALRLLACASARWCVAVDQQNHVLVSTDPRRGAVSWHLARGGPGRHLGNVGELACPSSSLCVGVAGHYVITSVQPSRGGTAWRQALVNPGAWEFSVGCPMISRCVAVSDDGQVLTTSDPTGRRPWTTTRLERAVRPIGSQSVSCASATQCVVTVGDDRVFSTSDLQTARPTWHQVRLEPEPAAGRLRLSVVVSCTSADVCAAAGNDGSVWASVVPGLSGHRAWKRVAFDRRAATHGHAAPTIACAPAGLCVVVEGNGDVLSANAIARPGAWRRQQGRG